MLSKLYRLKKDSDIKRVFKEGKTFKAPPLSLRLALNGSNHNKFGFVVSSKVAKKAFSRNKIRRRLSEITRSQLPKIKKEGGVQGFDLLIVAYPGTDKLSFAELKALLGSLLEKAKLCHG